MGKQDLLTVKDFCIIANISRTHFYNLLKTGSIKAVKDGRNTKVAREEYESWKVNLPAYVPTNSIIGGKNEK